MHDVSQINNHLKLENQLCFPLYAAAKEVVRQYRPILSNIGLTYTQYIVMMVLWQEQQINIKMLGEKVYLDSGTLTPLLKKMEQQKLLTRKRSSDDERQVIVSVTAKGEALKQEALRIPEQMQGCIDLDPGEMQTLYVLLYKVLGGLK